MFCGGGGGWVRNDIPLFTLMTRDLAGAVLAGYPPFFGCACTLCLGFSVVHFL